MLLLPTEATTEKKTNTCSATTVPHAIEDHKIFFELDLCVKTHNEHRAKGRQENVQQEGVIGSPTSATVTADFD